MKNPNTGYLLETGGYEKDLLEEMVEEEIRSSRLTSCQARLENYMRALEME